MSKGIRYTVYYSQGIFKMLNLVNGKFFIKYKNDHICYRVYLEK